MPVLGADPDQLRALSEGFDDAARRMQEFFAALRDDASHTTWVGTDAEVFHVELERVCLQGAGAAEQVHTRSRQLEKEADEQDFASSADAGASPHGPGTWNLPHGPGTWNLPHSPLPTWRVPMPEGAGLDPLETLDKASGVLRQLNSIRHQDVVEGMLGPGGKRMLKFLPILGAVPDAIEGGQALGDGDTGRVIGNVYETVLGVVPHPIAAGISLGNDIGDLALPGDSSPLELVGEVAAHGDRAQRGEMVGSAISDHLGHRDGSLANNMLTAGFGTGGHLSAMVSPFARKDEIASAIANWAIEEW